MNIAIIGAGTHGAGLAQIVALGGHAVALFDVDSQALNRARQWIAQHLEKQVMQGKTPRPEADRAKNAIVPVTVLEQCAEADFMIEAVPDQLEAKRTLFEKMDRIAPRTTILATTTATLSITAIATAAKRHPERVIGMHSFEPVTTHKLVEVIPGDQTAQDVVDRSLHLLRGLGKTAVTVKDMPGFLVNRVLTVYTGEALRLIGEGQITPEGVDKLMNSLGIEQGPFALMDTLGIDVHLVLTEHLYQAFYQEARYRPHPIQRKMVLSNRLGRKTRQGFHKYDE